MVSSIQPKSGRAYSHPSSPDRKRHPVTNNASRLLCLATLALTAVGSTACSSSTTSGPRPAPPGNTANTGLISSANTTRSSAQSATGPDPCGLLTDAEAATMLGGPSVHVAKGSKAASNGNAVTVTEHSCEWDLVTSDQLGHDLWIAVYTGADRRYFDQTGTSTDNAPISGIGDAAKGSSNHVYAFGNATMIQVYGSVVPVDGLQQVANLALAKLK
jgi:hypothetical protein